MGASSKSNCQVTPAQATISRILYAVRQQAAISGLLIAKQHLKLKRYTCMHVSGTAFPLYCSPKSLIVSHTSAVASTSKGQTAGT